MRRISTSDIESGGAAKGTGVALQRLLIATLVVQTAGALCVILGVLGGSLLIRDSIARIDLHYVQSIVESALHSAINVEEVTRNVRESVGIAMDALNNTAQGIELISHALHSPRLEITMPGLK